MALRVLLADESSTIKKVMQLALADFGVEVKSVPVGLDVLSVTKSFKPDIIFADVLLTKKSGYEVCFDLKNDSETAHVPVVLMWSGFMEIDETKATECRADRRLEKPFDADHLRSLVTDLVQKTTTNPISNFLSFPEMPDFDESPSPSAKLPSAIPTSFELEPKEEKVYNGPEAEESGLIKPLPKISLPEEEYTVSPLSEPEIPEDIEPDEGGWAHQDLSKFKLNIPDNEAIDFAAKFVIPQDEDLNQAHIEVEGDFEEVTFAKGELEKESFVSKVEKSVKEQMMETLQKGPKSKSASPNAEPKSQSKMDLSSDMIEKVVREEAREVIESVCWKLIPEIAERIVREEINKILKETEL